MFEFLPVFLIYMFIIFAPLMCMVAIYYVGLFILFCVYKHNGGKYTFGRFIDSRDLRL